MLRIRNQTTRTAEIYISGDIVDDEEGNEISTWTSTCGYEWPSEIKRQLEELRGKDLTIYINSYGGSVPAGLAMSNMISRHDGRTTAIVDGYCCSIATQIFFSADECKMPSNAYLMIHKPMSSVVGNAKEMRRVAESLDVIQEGLETTYRNKAHENIDSAAIHAMVENETWLTGAAVAEVFKIELLEPVSVVNCYGNRNRLLSMGIRSIPSKLQFVNEQQETKRQRIKQALTRAKGLMMS